MAAASAFVNLESNHEKVISFATEYCILFGLADDPEVVCPGIVALQAPVLLDMFASEIISKDRICN
jgi:hypothetical protein